MSVATGTFTIEGWEPDAAAQAAGLEVGAVRLSKRFSGDLVGTGTVRMVSAAIDGSPAVYVALELIDGSLLGRSGAFLLRHVGIMEGGEGRLDCSVVPGSGTGALAGLAGTFHIDVVDGEHRWRFEHSLD